MVRPSAEEVARFLAKTAPDTRGVSPIEPYRGECILWTGGRNKRGYGVFRSRVIACGVVRVHRYAWALWRTGPTPETVDHVCHVKLCVNPYHLEGLGVEAHNERTYDYMRNGTVHGYASTAVAHEEDEAEELARLRSEFF